MRPFVPIIYLIDFWKYRRADQRAESATGSRSKFIIWMSVVGLKISDPFVSTGARDNQRLFYEISLIEKYLAETDQSVQIMHTRQQPGRD